MEKASHLPERKVIRKQGYDYSSAGLYFITICTKDMRCLFGEIKDGYMILDQIGEVANNYWLEIPKHYDRVKIHEHIIMPNHVHGIIELEGTSHVGTSHGMSVQPSPNINQFGKPIPGSISMIMNQYKSSVKRWCNKNGHEYFQWQARFHDHIIRDKIAYDRISNYIINNPKKWAEDKFAFQNSKK